MIFKTLIENIFKKLKKRKVVVYSAIFGNYDELNEPPEERRDIDYIIFTDNKNLKSKFYKVIACKPISSDPARSAKIYKIMPHLFLSNYDYSVWIDGSVLLKSGFHKLIDLCIKNNYEMAFFKHPERDCIYQEGEACINYKKDESNIIKKQISKYRRENYPEHNGLISGGFIFRKNKSSRVIAINKYWWEEIKNYSKRDQLSFNYVAWRYNFIYQVINDEIWDNQYFKVLEHRK